VSGIAQRQKEKCLCSGVARRRTGISNPALPPRHDPSRTPARDALGKLLKREATPVCHHASLVLHGCQNPRNATQPFENQGSSISADPGIVRALKGLRTRLDATCSSSLSLPSKVIYKAPWLYASNADARSRRVAVSTFWRSERNEPLKD
jgi:hypothetical protein